MASITMENARHMMQKHPVFAKMGEEVRIVLDRMIKSNVKEIAIIDDQRRIVGDMTMLDLLEFLLAQKSPK
jgi:predicted transcriptional regulator